MVNAPIFLDGKVHLAGCTSERPLVLTVVAVIERKKEELPYKSDKDRYEAIVKDDIFEFLVTLNDRTLSNLVWKWGKDEKLWAGKKIGFWAVVKSIFGNERHVIYGRPME